MYTGDRVQANANLNNVTKPGMYRCMLYADAASLANTPVKYPFNLIVLDSLGDGRSCIQLLVSNGGPSFSGIYIRTLYGNEWGSWEKL